MSVGEVKEYKVAIGEEFLERLRQKSISQRDPSHTDVSTSSGFTIRYSAPPDLLRSDNCELNLRKTTRGEYLIEDASTGAGRELGTDQEEGSSTQQQQTKAGSGPSFRGPGTAAHEDECVLVYNEEKQEYELYSLNINLQVAPVLKGRPRSNNINPVLRPTSKGNSRQSTPKFEASPHKEPIPKTTPEASPTKAPSAALLPKTATRNKLPTRRKPPSKHTENKRDITPPRSPPIAPSMRSSSSTSASSTHEAVAPSPAFSPVNFQPAKSPVSGLNSENSSRASTAVSSLVSTPSLEPEHTGSEDIDEEFDDLADELADELMEDEENDTTQKTVGTAGGAAQDEDISSEEE